MSCRKSSNSTHISRPKTQKVGQHLGHLLKIREVAAAYGFPERTIRRWCEQGKLPAVSKSFGTKTTYLISPQAIEGLITTQKAQKISIEEALVIPQPHEKFLRSWIEAMSKGLINGKVFSQETVKKYSYYTENFISKYKTLSLETFKAELLVIPPINFAKRLKTYEALLCFGKFLIAQGQLETEFSTFIKSLRPKRHLPPKKITVDEIELQTLIAACKTIEERLIVVLLSQTGLRASEACALKLGDIELEKGFLTVQCGKGGKRRMVGLSFALIETVKSYLQEHPRPVSSHILHDINGKPMTRHGLRQRLERLGNTAKVIVTPHALRRAFVTINANKGRPLQMLQIACGHSDIQTTRSYCMTTEQEVIQAMREWY